MEIEENKFDKSIEIVIRLLKELRKLLKTQNRINGETILDNQDLCVLLKLSKRSLQRLRSEGILPYLQIGQKTFYLESDVMQYIQIQIESKKKRGENGSKKNPLG